MTPGIIRIENDSESGSDEPFRPSTTERHEAAEKQQTSEQWSQAR
jgi:hypothetical protein